MFQFLFWLKQRIPNVNVAQLHLQKWDLKGLKASDVRFNSVESVLLTTFLAFVSSSHWCNKILVFRAKLNDIRVKPKGSHSMKIKTMAAGKEGFEVAQMNSKPSLSFCGFRSCCFKSQLDIGIVKIVWLADFLSDLLSFLAQCAREEHYILFHTLVWWPGLGNSKYDTSRELNFSPSICSASLSTLWTAKPW